MADQPPMERPPRPDTPGMADAPGMSDAPGPDPQQQDAEARQGGARHAEVTINPQRLLRIASVTREVLEEARRIKPEPGAVDHLREVHSRISAELQESLPPELYAELDDLTPDIRVGSLEELALAHAEILGWLEGLFQGTQLALQMQAARAMFGQSRGPGGSGPPGELPSGDDTGPREQDPRYL